MQVKRNRRLSQGDDETPHPTFVTFGVGYDGNSHAAAFDARFPGIPQFKYTYKVKPQKYNF